MVIKSIIKKELEKNRPDKDTLDLIKKELESFKNQMNAAILKEEVDAEIFVGGSYAKGTLIKKDGYDVDIFVRFDWRYDNPSSILEKIIKRANIKSYEKIHGSRDYFRIRISNEVVFEIVPVTKIKKPEEARNVTDLSYFHVPYLKKKGKGLEDQIRIAKLFCQAQGVYGAESYIQGFSGYGLECLIIYYKSFEKMLKELMKAKDQIIIDIEGKYKGKRVIIEMNESKMHSPVVLVDPTYMERNALAALSHETFHKFQSVARKFIAKPSSLFFVKQKIDYNGIKKRAKKYDFVHARIKTDKQPGDIAGTKLKKFYKHLEVELAKYFKIKESGFEYKGMKDAEFYIIGSSKKEIVKIGPPLNMTKHVAAFKRAHKKTYEKNKMIHANLKIDFSMKDFVKDFAKTYKSKMEEMSVQNMEIIVN